MAKRLGQIDMFSKRVRTAVSPPLERSLHIAIADALRVGAADGWLWTHFPAGELRTEKTGALLKRMGTQTGWSDFLLVSPRGRFHALEIKRRGHKPTAEQQAFLTAVERSGGGAAWVDGFDDAIAILRGWGALSTRIQPQ